MREVLSRGDGFRWLVDPAVADSGIGLRDHEDWIDRHLILPVGGVFVDCGGFVGLHAVKAARRHEAAVVSFEPNPVCLEFLHENLRLNGVADRVRVVEKALCDRPGVARFCNTRAAASGLDDGGEIEVPTTTLDRELKHLARLDLLKIDVEGAEALVLRGGTEVCTRFRPRVVVEVHSHLPGCGHNGNLVSEWCRLHGYTHRRIFENTPAYYYLELRPN